MTQDKDALTTLLEQLRHGDGAELIHRLVAGGLQALVNCEAEARIGAGHYERSEDRTAWRNGTRDKLVSTAAGDVTVAIPKLRTGSFFPSLLTPRRRIDVALHAVICEAYVHGVSTRKVDDLVGALGIEAGISKSEVSRVCAQLDAEVTAWRDRPLTHTWFPYLYLDATYSQGPPGRPGGQPGGGGGHRGEHRRAAGGARPCRRTTARTRSFGPSSCGACASAAWRSAPLACSW